MRKVAGLVLLALAMSGCTMWPEKKHPGWSEATNAERLNALFWDDVANNRWKAVHEHVAPLAIWTEGGQKTTGADAIVARLQSEGFGPAQIGEMESQPAGADLVTTYTLVSGGKAPVRVLAVWQPTSKSWVLVAMSVTNASK